MISELLRGLPFRFYTASSIDALIHAMESYVSPKAGAYTQLYSRAAIEIIIDVFDKIARHGEEYRFQRFGDMLVASNYARIAFGNTGVGAVHARRRRRVGGRRAGRVGGTAGLAAAAGPAGPAGSQ